MGRRLSRKQLQSARRRRVSGIGVLVTVTMLAIGTFVVSAVAGADEVPPPEDTTQTTVPPSPTEPPSTTPATDPPAESSPAAEQPSVSASSTESQSVQSQDLTANVAPTCTGGPATWGCSINPGNVPASNPGYTPGDDCASALSHLSVPAPPNDWAWIFVAPKGTFVSLTATFQTAGTVGPVSPVVGVNAWPDTKHLYLFTKQGDTLTAATAVIANSEDPGQFVLSHVCAGATGSLNVTKVVQGPAPGGNPFTVDVNCNDGTSHDRTLVFTSAGALFSGGPLPITGIPATTQCTITETATGGAAVSYTPGGLNPPTVIIASNQESGVTVTNTFNEPGTGSLNVGKVVQGTPPGGNPFTVDVNCNDGTSHDRTLVFTSAGALFSGGPLPITGIPATTQCTITETATGGAAVSYTPGGLNPPTVTIVSGQQSSVTVTNTFTDVGGNILVSLNVNKEIVGANPPEGSQFKIHVVCTGDASTDTILTFTFSNGHISGPQQPISNAQIPSTGSVSCTVTETDPAGQILLGYKVDGGALQPGSPTVVLNVDKPVRSATVVNDPERARSGSTLPFTGSSPWAPVAFAIGLVSAGGALVLLDRRRRTSTA